MPLLGGGQWGRTAYMTPSRYRPFPSSKCIFFCFLSNKREERDYLLSLFVLLYVELASFGTPPTPHTHARRHHKPRHSPHHATLGRGAMGTYCVHDTSPAPPRSWSPPLILGEAGDEVRSTAYAQASPLATPCHSWEGGDGVVRRTRHIPAPAPDRPLLGASCLGEAGDEVVRHTQYFE